MKPVKDILFRRFMPLTRTGVIVLIALLLFFKDSSPGYVLFARLFLADLLIEWSEHMLYFMTPYLYKLVDFE